MDSVFGKVVGREVRADVFGESEHSGVFAATVVVELGRRFAHPHHTFGLGGGGSGGEPGRHRSNIWTYAGANTFRKGRLEDLAVHSTVKPRKLVADAILDCSKPGGIVLDPFLGSGTTLVACAMTGRIGRGIELDPKYMDVILKRVSDATGCEPLLDGATPLSVVAAGRQHGED